MNSPVKILVLGATGMLGNAVYRLFASSPGYLVYGSVRSIAAARRLPSTSIAQLIGGLDVENLDSIVALLSKTRPDYVINCIGVVKQLAAADDVLAAVPINSLFPHRLSRLCSLVGARLVHMSTDCVFAGTRGMYVESDHADAYDVYGRSKLLGELHDSHVVTLRTSIIGHELAGARSLINWFLTQDGEVKGYTKAIFSGLPTVEVARVIRDYVISHPEINGIYHLSADPISKFDLLKLVASVYGKNITIRPENQLVIDRSLDSTRFRQRTGFVPDPWPVLVRRMYEFG
jgi:dTDP-4-dehydrorhamnose reductase